MSSRKSPEKRRSKETGRNAPPPASESTDNTARNICLAIAAAIAIAAASTYKSSTGSSSNESSAVSAAPALPEPAGPKPDLFRRLPKNDTVQKKDIAAKLPKLIEAYGRIIAAPAQYDPSKENFYIIGAGHVDGNPGEKDNSYVVQENIVRIFHVLYALGTQRQFIEGVEKTTELKHDGTHSELAEKPLTALPKYKKTGKINRAYIAIEGIYGDDVESFGAEDVKRSMAINRSYQEADREFGLTWIEITESLAKELSISYDSALLRKGKKYFDGIVAEIRKKTAQMKEKDLQKLVSGQVLSNHRYADFLSKAAEWYYERIQGRNTTYASVIFQKPTKAGDKKDAVMIVGTEHALHLAKILGVQFNTFIILTKDVDERHARKFFSLFDSEDKYRQAVLKHDLYTFGVGPKPDDSLFGD
jgi:hypothetical protein